MRRFVPAVLNVVVLVVALSGLARAEDFRIDSKIYAGKQTEPISQSVTLFRAGLVYDYLVEPKRVAVFDKPRGRFILLDPERKLRTEIETSEVARFMSELEQYASTHGTAFVKGVIDPKFEASMDQKTGELMMIGNSITYRLETIKPESQEVVQQYREFSDWYARLNAMARRDLVGAQRRDLLDRQRADDGADWPRGGGRHPLSPQRPARPRHCRSGRSPRPRYRPAAAAPIAG